MIATIVFALTFWIKEIAAIGLMILIIHSSMFCIDIENENKSGALDLALQNKG